MPDRSLHELSEEIVAEFLSEGRKLYTNSWNISKDDDVTSDELVLIMIRRSKRRNVVEMVTAPSGEHCPLCDGTGRI